MIYSYKLGGSLVLLGASADTFLSLDNWAISAFCKFSDWAGVLPELWGGGGEGNLLVGYAFGKGGGTGIFAPDSGGGGGIGRLML